MMISIVAVLFAVAGALVYALASSPLSDLGRLTFLAAMIGLMVYYAAKPAHVGGILISIVAVLFAIIGALVYALAGNAKAKELGRLTFLASMIGLMIAFASHVVRIG